MEIEPTNNNAVEVEDPVEHDVQLAMTMLSSALQLTPEENGATLQVLEQSTRASVQEKYNLMRQIRQLADGFARIESELFARMDMLDRSMCVLAGEK